MKLNVNAGFIMLHTVYSKLVIKEFINKILLWFQN